MANQKQTGVISRLWTNWCSLEPQQRNQVAQKLGPMGQVLTIAANVHQFVNNPQQVINANPQQGPQSNSRPHPQNPQNTQTSTEEDDDFIDVEFEETE